MRILVISHAVPFPPVSGGDLRTYYLTKALASTHQTPGTGHDVTVVGFNCGGTIAPPPFPVRTLEFPWEPPKLWEEMRSGDPETSRSAYETLLNETDEPWFVSCMQSAGMEEMIRRVARDGFDLVIIHHTNMARLLPALPRHVPKILNLHNVHALIALRAAEEASGEERAPAWLEAERTRQFERRVASACDLCLTVSEQEAEAARSLLGIEHVQVVPNGVDTTRFAPSDAPVTDGSILFTGTMNYAPNIEAVQWFTRKILPRIRLDVPEAKFHIVGAYPTPEVTALASDDVVVHGRVVTMLPYYREAAVVVVPLRHGGGTRHKILEAAACGKPIVSTALGAEGLDFRPGEDLELADDPAEFARAVVRLLRDDGRRRHLGRRARGRAERYDWGEIGSRYRQLAERLVGAGPASPRAEAGRDASGQGTAARSVLGPGSGSPRDSGIKGRIFLVGCPRSGTTLLQSLVAAHSQITSFPESHFFPSLLPEGSGAPQDHARFLEFMEQFGFQELHRQLAEAGWPRRRSIEAFVGVLDSLTLQRGKDRWLEKTPGNLDYIGAIEEHIDDALFIHLLRNGPDVVASLYEVTHSHPRRWAGPWDLDDCINKWNHDVSYSMNFTGAANHLMVRYEQLVERPEAVLRDVCGFLGVGFRREMIERQPEVARTLMRGDEPWKTRAAEAVGKAAESKFARLFDEPQRAYILRRLIELPMPAPGGDPPG